MPNRLVGEHSPYLKQHAQQPVAWRSWGKDAFAQAQAEQKPIFLSIGYSTCHWCHVMARESFEDLEIAALLNRHFIPVKVDREERPEVDHVYMTFVQAATGYGGWPLSVWLTPDLKPFFGGTYFPPRDVAGRRGFLSVLGALAEAWATDREHVAAEANRIIASLRAPFQTETGKTEARLSLADVQTALDRAFLFFSKNFDARWGGFGRSPKFPRASNFDLLFLMAERKGPNAAAALEMAELTLVKMAQGGICDQIGGGFHRYSVDEEWFVPHFEKMLYDQAQLARSYLEAHRLTGKACYAQVARGIFDYVQRDLVSPEGAFFSAEDADSPVPEKPEEHAEGAFYLWTLGEVEKIVGAEAPWVCAAFGLRPAGNIEHDPYGEFAGKNLPRLALLDAEDAVEKRELPACGLAEKLAISKEKLRHRRNSRPRPARDDKIVTAWNGLMVSALAMGGRLLGEKRYLAAAVRASEFVERALADASRGVLFRSYCGGRSEVEGFASDYAFWIQGLIDLYEATFEVRWLQKAVQYQQRMDALFWDPAAGGYFDAAAGEAAELLRLKEDYDGAEPAASSIAARNLLRLALVSGDEQGYRHRSEQTAAAFSSRWTPMPESMPAMLCSAALLGEEPGQIVLTGDPDSPRYGELRAIVDRRAGGRSVYSSRDEEGWLWLKTRMPWLTQVRPDDDKALVYLCEHYTCRLPVAAPDELAALLA